MLSIPCSWQCRAIVQVEMQIDSLPPGSGHAKHSLQLALPSYRAAGDAKLFRAGGAARSGHAMQQRSPNIITDGSLRSHAFAAGYLTCPAYSQGPQQRLLKDVPRTAKP
eukprot:gene13456-19314_t